MKRFITFAFSLFFSMPFLHAQSSTSLAEEFAKLNEYLKNPKQTAEEKKKILETNVMNSVRNTLAHKFANPRKELKEIKIQDMQTERPEGTNNLFVKYKNYYISYSFVADPEKYLTSPVEESVLEKPAGADLSAAHTDEKQTSLSK
ncbi:hypothetical protein EHQ58_13930 [Leptospira ognonensis]|uniref:Uncharacterized protein n=1 Tax=Leptospira ognonensis TaxID=2484945 RepID=A0A4V3JQV5_9LEPT|nr:hypothetical protein [Leptospira ognonensis]TGL57386.1 hypothetical protein EHQ58_13930 [Leptospira ognonensis]